jgi:hypothetical protein
MAVEYIGDVERSDEHDFSLEIYECTSCGFTIGFDASFLRTSHVETTCPGCHQFINVEAFS